MRLEETKKFDFTLIGRKCKRDKFLDKMLKSPAIMASEVSTIVLPETLNEFCDRLKILVQAKQAGNSSDIFNEETVAIADKLLE